MKFLNFKLVFILVIAAFCFSCKKNQSLEANDLDELNEDITVSNGMLVFKNSDVLKSTIRQISSFSPEQYKQWVKSHPGFDSYKVVF
ncbi:hypothetical protein GCM10023231_10390 [Olivibacter ginsenosidimutans]|uniref:Uncharacterized protein n=1 Tax=Olivibacter ginsenosidimutans TaxID=1176537 RepID=A0ABP9APZ3_9SPHI